MLKRCTNSLEPEETVLTEDTYDSLHIHESFSRAKLESILHDFSIELQQHLQDSGLLVIVLTAGYGSCALDKSSVMLYNTPQSI